MNKFLGEAHFKSNNVEHAKRSTCIFSSTAFDGFYITPENFRAVIGLISVRALAKQTWITDQDRFIKREYHD